MSLFSDLRKISGAVLLSGLMFGATSTQATIVRFETVMGNIDVNLFDKTTPETVKNFLYYLNAGAYNDGVIHRSADITENNVARNFVIQGGSFIYNGSMPLSAVKTIIPVNNEPFYSNVRGTIAVAKSAGNPNSGTSGWFFNMEDNDFLNSMENNGGYTVFGQVTPASLPVMDAIAAVNTFFVSSSPEFPIRDYTVDDYKNNEPVDETNLVLITSVTIIDSNPDSAASLNPAPNPDYKPPVEKDNDGGGSVGGWYLGLLALLALTRRRSAFYRA